MAVRECKTLNLRQQFSTIQKPVVMHHIRLPGSLVCWYSCGKLFLHASAKVSLITC